MQHLPAAHTPPLHAVPSVRVVSRHLPEVQLVVAQELVVEQIEHVPPPEPQALMEVPVSHVVPDQQPVQHVPWPQVPPLHTVPVATGVAAQTPELQLSVTHGFLVSQSLQSEPAVPHTALVWPVWQVAPSQQPVQHPPA